MNYDKLCFTRAKTRKIEPGAWKPGKIYEADRCTCNPDCRFRIVRMDLYWRCPGCNAINASPKRACYVGSGAICEACYRCSRHFTGLFDGLGEITDAYYKKWEAKHPVKNFESSSE